jgi:hypothetical protein
MNLLRPPTPGPAPTAKALEELEEALPMNESPNSKSSQSKTLQGGNTVELWYANRIYSVKVKPNPKSPNPKLGTRIVSIL